jgi:hypothetical protein
MPVHDDKRLATSKQPMKNDTKRCVALFMGFLLYLLVVVVQDALTSPCVAAFRSYLCVSSFLSRGMGGQYVFTSAYMKALMASTGFLSRNKAAEYTRHKARSRKKMQFSIDALEIKRLCLLERAEL